MFPELMTANTVRVPNASRPRGLTLLALGFQAPAGLGRPPRLFAGRAPAGPREVALDRAAAIAWASGWVAASSSTAGPSTSSVSPPAPTSSRPSSCSSTPPPQAALSGYGRSASFVAVGLVPGEDRARVAREIRGDVPGALRVRRGGLPPAQPGRGLRGVQGRSRRSARPSACSARASSWRSSCRASSRTAVVTSLCCSPWERAHGWWRGTSSSGPWDSCCSASRGVQMATPGAQRGAQPLGSDARHGPGDRRRGRCAGGVHARGPGRWLIPVIRLGRTRTCGGLPQP